MSLEALFAVPANLPTVPKVVQQLIHSFGRDDVSVDEIADTLASDPVLSAKTLRLANSAYFHVSRSISTVDDALRMLGFVMVRNLVVGCGMTGAFKAVQGMDLPQFWRYSLNTAKLARSLAGLVHHNQIAAYTAGLLHAVGELLLHLADPETVLSINTLVSPLDLRRAKIEQRILGYCYGNVSAGLAQRWQFPDVVVEALQHQSAPLDNNVYEPLAGVIHLASWRARAREADLGEKEMAVSFPGEVGLMLGLDIDMVLQQDPIDWTARPEASDYVV